MVFQKSDVVADEDYEHDRVDYYNSDCEDVVEEEYDPSKYELLSRLDELGGLPDHWRRVAVKDVDSFVTACFTEQGAKDFIAAQGRNLNKPFIYASSLYRNTEMIGLREFLLTQSEADTAP